MRAARRNLNMKKMNLEGGSELAQGVGISLEVRAQKVDISGDNQRHTTVSDSEEQCGPPDSENSNSELNSAKPHYDFTKISRSSNSKETAAQANNSGLAVVIRFPKPPSHIIEATNEKAIHPLPIFRIIEKAPMLEDIYRSLIIETLMLNFCYLRPFNYNFGTTVTTTTDSD